MIGLIFISTSIDAILKASSSSLISLLLCLLLWSSVTLDKLLGILLAHTAGCHRECESESESVLKE